MHVSLAKMNASSWRKAADLIAQGTQANQQVQAAATTDSSQLESFPLSALSADDSGPPQVNYGTEQLLAVSTPTASSTSTRETQVADTYHQIIPGMSEHLYPTLIADGSLSTPAADNCSTLQRQIPSEIDKYLQEAAEEHERDDTYYDGWHVATNTSSPQQEANLLEQDDDAGSDEEDNNAIVSESHGQDTGAHHGSPPGHNIQPQDELETIPEEEPHMEEKQYIADQDTVVFTPDESEEEPFNTAIDDTSDDLTIVMGKPVTTAFISDDVCIPTEKVGCLQVTSQLQKFLNHFPPESIEKAFEQIYQILQVLDAYLIDNPQQHQYCMSPDSEYISLIMYTTKLEIDLCNFLAIWAVLSILLDIKSNKLQYVKNLQQVVNDYYEKCPMEAMRRLEQQTSEILDVMYDSVTNQNFDRVSNDIDRVSGVVDNNFDKIDTDNIQMLYDNDNDTATGEMKYERNMTNELKDIDTNDTVPYERDNNMMTKVKCSIETNDIDNRFLRDYENMHKSMEDRQINDFYEARRHIQSTMMGDTPVKTVLNRQCIDNVSDYDSDHHRISKSMRHRLDLGPIRLPGAQQHTTVEAAAALKMQDKIEGKFKAHMQSNNGQCRNEMYKRAENMIPQLDGTYNISDNSDTDSHDYLDLAGTNIISYRTIGQKQRHEENEVAYANRHSAHIEYTKPNTKVKTQRQKVPDDEDIDIAKIVKDVSPNMIEKEPLKLKGN